MMGSNTKRKSPAGKGFRIATCVFILMFAFGGASLAQTGPAERIDIIDFGIYRALRIQQEDAPAAPAGVLGHVANLELLEATATIPALQGVRFGFQFKISGYTGANAGLKFVILIPEPGIQLAGKGKRIVRTEYFRYIAAGQPNYLGYKFDYPWEIVLGKWTLEIWDGSRKLASQSFNISASV